MSITFDGMIFKATIDRVNNDTMLLTVFTEATCCNNLSYFTKIDNDLMSQITDAINTNHVSLAYVNDHKKEVEFTYWTEPELKNKIILDECLEFIDDEIDDKIVKIQIYFELIAKMKAIENELAAAYAELDSIIECEGLTPRVKKTC